MQNSETLADIIAGWFKAAARGDAACADKHLSKRSTMLLVGTDPDEWVRGKAAAKFLMAEAKASGVKIKVNVGKVEAHREGTVGWGIANPTITLPHATQR
jgi:ketosteroid isomerase-like protein